MNGHDRNGNDRSQPPGSLALPDAADLEARAIDQAVAGSDGGSADVDQAVSDVDRAASERDAGALDEAYRIAKAEHGAGRIGRPLSRANRAGAADARLDASRRRDRNAALRDDAAGRRDLRAVELEQQLAASDAPVREQLDHLRQRAAADRAAAAADRRRAATARTEAASARTEAATELARLRTALHRASLDGLTGAFGRALGNQALQQEIDRSRRDDGRLVLASIDVDGLKAINDRAGHAAGDLVLRTLVDTMRSSLRSIDPIVRYGGDEFVCAVAGFGIEEVDGRFEAIRRSLYADTGASISVGLASLAEHETLDQLTARADVALADSKRMRPA